MLQSTSAFYKSITDSTVITSISFQTWSDISHCQSNLIHPWPTVTLSITARQRCVWDLVWKQERMLWWFVVIRLLHANLNPGLFFLFIIIYWKLKVKCKFTFPQKRKHLGKCTISLRLLQCKITKWRWKKNKIQLKIDLIQFKNNYWIQISSFFKCITHRKKNRETLGNAQYIWG